MVLREFAPKLLTALQFDLNSTEIFNHVPRKVYVAEFRIK
jgi:hypothetical protein